VQSKNDFYALLTGVAADLQDVRVLWQVGVIAASLLIAWWLARDVRTRLGDADAHWKVSAGGLKRVAFPLIALVLVCVGRVALRTAQDVHLVDLAVPLLISWLLVRLLVYVMRVLFSGSWLQTFERLIFWVVWLGFVLHITGLAPDLVQFLDDISFHLGKQRISLWLVLEAVLSVAAALLVAMWLARLIEGRIMNAGAFDINLRVMLSKLTRALIVIAAGLIVLPAIGIDLTVLSVFGGALGVGLGLGLQKIASNYLSGFIILMDRSIRMGDMVTVDNRSGKLVKMTARYVVVRAQEGTEALIPNDTIITSTVINHTYSDRRTRLAVSVQVGYQSDLRKVMQLMVERAKQHERVLPDPEPTVLITGFADNGIALELGVWLHDPEQGQGNLRSELLLEIWEEFKRNGVEVPYPQREVRILPGSSLAPPAPN
jgi:small-conductance mechanosensitive channel